MNDKQSSKNQTAQRHVPNEELFLKSLCDFWKPHQRRDLEIRYQLGVMLNGKLGSPSVRQNYGIGTIKLISEELSIDKSDISRMRRFAAKYESFEAFVAEEPDLQSWTQVREMIAKSKASKTTSDARASSGAKRSIESLIKVLSADHNFADRDADEIRCALRELFSLAQAELGFDLETE